MELKWQNIDDNTSLDSKIDVYSDININETEQLKATFDGKRLYFIVKRAFDILAATGSALYLFPALVLIAVSVRISSPGPAIFKQIRYGRNGKKFYILKFRTLYYDRSDFSGADQSFPCDPRVTPLGRFLRRSNLDELPQLWNVIRGEMSLVGPRPHPVGLLVEGSPCEIVVSNYALRHIVRPGITGLAQINGFRGSLRNREQLGKRIAYDLAYIRESSFWGDLKILVKTAIIEFS